MTESAADVANGQDAWRAEAAKTAHIPEPTYAGMGERVSVLRADARNPRSSVCTRR